jgi:hypothetical protein
VPEEDAGDGVDAVPDGARAVEEDAEPGHRGGDQQAERGGVRAMATEL